MQCKVLKCHEMSLFNFSQRIGHRFDPDHLHQIKGYGLGRSPFFVPVSSAVSSRFLAKRQAAAIYA